MFAEIGEDCYLETPFYSEWAGKFCRFGKGIYANFNLMLVDDGEITVGDNTVIGAGSLVTKDIPANVVAYGSPCKVVRPITEEDETYYRPGHLLNEAL